MIVFVCSLCRVALGVKMALSIIVGCLGVMRIEETRKIRGEKEKPDTKGYGLWKIRVNPKRTMCSDCFGALMMLMVSRRDDDVSRRRRQLVVVVDRFLLRAPPNAY
jgi:hypothetical protein